MKKDLAIHFIFLFSFFILISLFKGWFSLEYLPFWFGGILGTLLTDLDHLIYIYLLKPKEMISQQIAQLISQKQFAQTWNGMSALRGKGAELIFHQIYFQLIFLVFGFPDCPQRLYDGKSCARKRVLAI